jgi:hypothetical protein
MLIGVAERGVILGGLSWQLVRGVRLAAFGSGARVVRRMDRAAANFKAGRCPCMGTPPDGRSVARAEDADIDTEPHRTTKGRRTR